MKGFRVINPTIPMCNEMFRLTCNYIHWEERFRKNLGHENRENMKKALEELKNYIRKNTEKIPTLPEDEHE